MMLARPTARRAVALSKTPACSYATRLSCNEVFPGVPEGTPAPVAPRSATVTSLPNGVKVVASEAPGHLTSVGVFIKGGSRNEVDGGNGAAHFAKQMAFRRTTNRSHFRTVRELEHAGANVSATSGREQIVLRADVLNSNVGTVVPILGETVRNNIKRYYELEDARSQVIEESNSARADANTFLSEAVHATAFNSATLGNNVFSRSSHARSCSVNDVEAFKNATFNPENIVVAGVGIGSDQLLSLAKDAFGDMQSFAAETQALLSSPTLNERIFDNDLIADLRAGKQAAVASANQASKYTGGELRMNHASPLSTFSVGFQGVAFGSKDHLALSLLQAVMGSPNGSCPGRGAHARLGAATAGLTGLHSATTFMNSYTDNGLFGVQVVATPSGIAAASDKAIGALLELASKPVVEADLKRARAHVKASYEMYLESNKVALVDMGSQLLLSGKVTPVAEVIKNLGAVTPADLTRVATALLKSRPTVVAHGAVSKMPTRDEVSKRFGQ